MNFWILKGLHKDAHICIAESKLYKEVNFLCWNNSYTIIFHISLFISFQIGFGLKLQHCKFRLIAYHIGSFFFDNRNKHIHFSLYRAIAWLRVLESNTFNGRERREKRNIPHHSGFLCVAYRGPKICKWGF